MNRGSEQNWFIKMNRKVKELAKNCSTPEDFLSETERAGYIVSDEEIFLGIYWTQDFIPTQNKAILRE